MFIICASKNRINKYYKKGSTFSFTSGMCYVNNNNIYNEIRIYIELTMSALKLMQCNFFAYGHYQVHFKYLNTHFKRN